MRSRAFLALAVLLLLPAMPAQLAGQSASSGPAAAPQKQDKKAQAVQAVKLTVDDKGNYAMTPASVAKGLPVKMDVDLQSVKGCARTVVISAFNVKKTVKEGDTTIEFTPTKAGKIDIVCGMNMVKGTFTVTD